MRGVKSDLVGQRFGRLLVEGEVGKDNKKATLWQCRCDCGNTTTATTARLNNGYKTRCGVSCRLNIKFDLTGQRFGLLVAEGLEKNNHNRSLWRCRCDCGGSTLANTTELRRGNRQSCGSVGCRNRPNLIGQRFGKLLIESVVVDGSGKNGQRLWLCRCDCGKSTTATTGALIYGQRTSCGCFRDKDLTGRTFERLTVIKQAGFKPSGTTGKRARTWECQCSCGNKTVLATSQLTTGSTQSCGCLKPEATSKRFRKHGLCKTKGYIAALAAKRRARARENGGNFTAQQIDNLFGLQKGLCAYCKTTITASTLHRDHIMPLARGGTNDIYNIQLLCGPCNRRKHDKDPFKFAQTQGMLF